MRRLAIIVLALAVASGTLTAAGASASTAAAPAFDHGCNDDLDVANCERTEYQIEQLDDLRWGIGVVGGLLLVVVVSPLVRGIFGRES